MSQIHVNACAVLGSGLVSQVYDLEQQGDAECEPLSGRRVNNFATRHISRKEQFYNQKDHQQQVPSYLEGEVNFDTQILQSQSLGSEDFLTRDSLTMHPEEAQMTHRSNAFQIEKQLNTPEQESAEEQIDVENCSVNGSSNGRVNGNGGSISEISEKECKLSIGEDGEALSDSTVSDTIDPLIRKSAAPFVKHNRRSSTSSRSSSVSSVPSIKQQARNALQMDVSSHEDLVDNMEPLLVQGSAEDLEVSSSELSSGGVGVEDEDEETSMRNTISDDFTDKVEEPANLISAENNSQMPKMETSNESGQSVINTSSLKGKSPKVSKKKQLINVVDTSDGLGVHHDQQEKKSPKVSKSPSRRNKNVASKQDQKNVDEKGDEKGEIDSGLRRSSRPRHTPQKYNASLFLDYSYDSPLAEERMNSSEAVFGATIRSVRGRRSLRKSRNISSLNSSLHNDSSPWETDFKVLTPSHGALSISSSEVDKNLDTPAPVKRKAEEAEDGDEDDGQEAKKLCVEESIDGSTSSFFSVVTSPFTLLKNKLHRRSVSCSTPLKTEEKKEVAAGDDLSKEDVQPASNDNSQTRSWCSIM